MILALQIICVLLGIFYLIAGALKVCDNTHMIEEFNNFGLPHWLRVLAGAIELVAAPLMLMTFWWPHIAATGALLMCPVMFGATWTNFAKRPAKYGWGTAVLLVLCVAIACILRPMLI
jgi:uncharacterized membrane protein YphA (DoxX/SURF4 family)